MATKWDPLVKKYQSKDRKEIGIIVKLRLQLKESQDSREKVVIRQKAISDQIAADNALQSSDLVVMKVFLRDLSELEEQCNLQISNISESLAAFEEVNKSTKATVRKYEFLQEQTARSVRLQQLRIENEALDEWASQRHVPTSMAR